MKGLKEVFPFFRKNYDRNKRFKITALTSKDLDLIRIPITVAQPFICELRCFKRIDPETATLGSHSGAFSFFMAAHVMRKA